MKAISYRKFIQSNKDMLNATILFCKYFHSGQKESHFFNLRDKLSAICPELRFHNILSIM